MKLKDETVEQVILKTLIYADIFNWPVREDEIFAQSQKSKVKSQNYIKNLRNLRTVLDLLVKSGKIIKNKNYYFLPEKTDLVLKRLGVEKEAKRKMEIARQTAPWLKIIPTILLTGVSGSLAVGNVGKDDDIDFFIICRNGSLWITRFLSTLLLDILGKRRRPNNTSIRDKICLNMFVDQIGMVVPEKEKDVYTAHEIKQLKVLWQRDNIYPKFLKANNWIYKNSKLKAQNSKVQGKSQKFCALSCSFNLCFLSFALKSVESFLRWLQLLYMNKKRTSEKIEEHRLLFHPKDRRREILKEYKKRLHFYKINNA
jgi:hypothetical protein